MPLDLKKWDELPTEYRWAAQDEDGLWYAYTVIPEAIDNHWWHEARGKCAEIGQQDPPKPNWRSTLIIRDYVLPQWDQVPDWANYLAQDANGGWYAYINKPHTHTDYWGWAGDALHSPQKIFTAAPNPGWKSTLQERPNMQNEPNWNELPSWVNWVAQDSNGRWYGYENKPNQEKNNWALNVDEGRFYLWHNAVPHWRNTLQERPKPAYNPWDNAPNWANYVAQDEEGQWYAYMNKPYLIGPLDTEWVEPSPEGCVKFLTKLAPNPSWKDTLQERPQEPNYYFWGIQCSQQ